ncbi:hypothetical protein LTR12_015409 [Friedmanniomyces endolithicus]|nr:hypothetical protein LTR12_015409 [Friedmanniomyces endolithicus]
MQVQSFVNRPPASHAALVVVTLLPLYLASYRYRLWYPYGGTGSTAVNALSSATFVADWLDVHVIQPFHPSAIAAYCNRSEWHPNLVFTLVDGAEDGMAENVLDFPFYTTEAGASIVLPSFAAHGAGRAGGGITQENMPFCMLFDETWFLSSMTQARPQMAIYKPEQDHKMADALPGTYLPKSRKVDMDLRNTKKAFLEHLDVWLKEKPEFEPDQLTLVNVERTPWQVDTRNLPQEFRRCGRNAAARSYGCARVNSQIHDALNPTSTIPRNAFYGAYMDTRNALASESYSNFSAQTDAHLEQAILHNIKLIYIASNNTTELALFRVAAAN